MSRTVHEPARDVPVVGAYEVVVVGGGPAGLMAAAAASRAGRSTLLVERYGFLGGAGTMGGLSTFCGLHTRVHGELEWRSNLTQLSNDDGSPIDGTDVRQLTRGEIQGRRQVRETFDFIKAVTPGFEDSYVVDIAPQVGIRETRRIVARTS